MTLAILETSLYVRDVAEATRFYRDVLGLELVYEADELMVTFRCQTSYLLIFNAELSKAPDRGAPPHGCQGEGHVAFRVEADALPGWRARLASMKVPIEREVTWNSGGVSIYFRDPTGNSIELAPRSVWAS